MIQACVSHEAVTPSMSEVVGLLLPAADASPSRCNLANLLLHGGAVGSVLFVSARVRSR